MGINFTVSDLQIFRIVNEKACSRVIEITFRRIKAIEKARKGQKLKVFKQQRKH
jgi:hypothetical protein